MAIFRVEIPFRLPSCNTYINECRRNRYAAAKLKSDVENDIRLYFRDLPHIDKPVRIKFTWIEPNRKRDLDGICFGKKFILDALVKHGVLSNDNRKHVTAFTDVFEYDKDAKDAKVVLEIEEVEE